MASAPSVSLHSHAEISSLVSLITSAAHSIEKYYQDASPTKPHIPFLSDTEPHPLDRETTHPDVRVAIQILEGACAQLCASVARPQHVMVNKLMQTFEASAYHVVLKFGIADILSTVKPPTKGMHISEISRRSGVDQDKLGRLLRLLTSKHVFSEVSEEVFANNRLSMMLHSSNELSSIAGFLCEESRTAGCHLADVLADPIWGPSTLPKHSPFSRSLGIEEGIFEWYESPAGAKQGARFGRGMIGWGDAIEAGAVVTEFPWGDLAPGTTVCDVGGGIGAISMQLVKRYPSLRIKLQDTPERIRQAQEEVWPKSCPEALVGEGEEQRIEFKPIDFLKESPIEGCDIYFMKNIILDWPDSECVTILKNIKASMKPNSRILIHEYVLSPASLLDHSGEGVHPPAPEPLLPNYGAGAIRQYNLDISVMTILNSKQRTLKEFVGLGEKAGLRFVKVWRVGEMGLVELGLDETGAAGTTYSRL